MNNDIIKEIETLKSRITELENKRQQLSFPLDQNTQDIINERKLVFSDRAETTVVADKSIRVTIDGQIYQINVL